MAKPKLGVVPQPQEPVDPFKKQGPPSLGVVDSTQVSAVPEKAPKLGAVRERPSQVVSIQQEAPPQIGVVPPAVSPSAPPPQAPPVAVGIHTDETPVYPPPPPPQKPALGEVKDFSITPPKAEEDQAEPAPPVATQPIVLDPLEPKE